MMLSNLKHVKWDILEKQCQHSSHQSLWDSATAYLWYRCWIYHYTLVKIVRGQAKEVHAVMWVLDALFILNFVSLAIL